MKKFKQLITVFFLTVLLSFSFVGCANVSTPTGTMSERYVTVFEQSVEKSSNLSDIAKNVIDSKVSKYSLKQAPASEGFLLGFKAKEIKGFSEGICISTKTSSIPFIAYLFKSDAPEALLETLKSNADEAFQICVVADETGYSIKNNVVFFILCPKE